MKRLVLVFVACCSLFFSAFPAHAQIPRTLSYQGVLTDAAGKPRPDGDYQFTFQLYDVPTSGTPIWTEQRPLQVTNGLFSTALGGVCRPRQRDRPFCFRRS